MSIAKILKTAIQAQIDSRDAKKNFNAIYGDNTHLRNGIIFNVITLD